VTFDLTVISGAFRIRTNVGTYYSNVFNTSGNQNVTLTLTNGSDFWFNSFSGFTGSITNVSVKEVIVGDGDFDVTRATAATRVDENGLVNYAEIVGSEEVNCGDFSCATPTDYWTATYSVISFSNNQITIDDTAGAGPDSRATQNFPTISGSVYRLKVNRISTTSSFWLSVGNGTSYNNIKYLNLGTTTGEYTIEFTALGSSSTISLQVGGSGISIYSDVSVKEVTRDNVPRIDYSGGGCPHILAEPMRTNLVTYSEDFTTWTTTGSANVTSNTTISPDGTQNADTLDLLAGDYFYKPITSGAGTFTLSCYVKVLSGTLDFKMQSFSGTDGANASSVFTANTNWQRFEFTTTVTVDSNFYPVQVSGLVGGDFEIWGAQLELGSYPTSMIPTSGSTVTRNQDQFSRDGISSLINSTEGVLFVEMAALANDSTNRMISLYGSGNDKLTLFYKTASNSMTVQGFVGGSLQINRTVVLTDITQFSKIAIRYKTNDFAWYVDGAKVTDDTTTNTWSANTLTKLSFDDGASGNPLFAKVKQLRVYDTALTDEELIQITGTSGTDFYKSYAEAAAASTYIIQ
jgi:hypothetical protein